MKIDGQTIDHLADLKSIIAKLKQLKPAMVPKQTIFQALRTNSPLTEAQTSALSAVLNLFPENNHTPIAEHLVHCYSKLFHACFQGQYPEQCKVFLEKLKWMSRTLENFHFLSEIYAHEVVSLSEMQLGAYKKRMVATAPASLAEQIEQHLALGAILWQEADYLSCNAALEQESIKHYAMAYKLHEGENIDTTATVVLQHEVGFSSEKKLGTFFIHQCVVLVIRDPMTHQTALAHVDYLTDTSSLANTLMRFRAEASLEVSLLGARLKSNNTPAITAKCHANVERVIAELKKYPQINIIAADILDKPSPTAVVVNPVNGSMIQAMPDCPEETLGIRHLLNLKEGEITTPLHVAFNDPDGEKYVPQLALKPIEVYTVAFEASWSNWSQKYPNRMAEAIINASMNYSARGYCEKYIRQPMMQNMIQNYVTALVARRIERSTSPAHAGFFKREHGIVWQAIEAGVPYAQVKTLIGKRVLVAQVLALFDFEKMKHMSSFSLKQSLQTLIHQAYDNALLMLKELTESYQDSTIPQMLN